MDYLIKNGRIADKNGCYEADLIIKNGKITYIGDGLDATGLKVLKTGIPILTWTQAPP